MYLYYEKHGRQTEACITKSESTGNICRNDIVPYCIIRVTRQPNGIYKSSLSMFLLFSQQKPRLGSHPWACSVAFAVLTGKLNGLEHQFSGNGVLKRMKKVWVG